MGTRRKVAIWFKRGNAFYVNAPGWDSRVGLVFSSQDDMIAWSHGAGVVLKDGNKRR